MEHFDNSMTVRFLIINLDSSKLSKLVAFLITPFSTFWLLAVQGQFRHLPKLVIACFHFEAKLESFS